MGEFIRLQEELATLVKRINKTNNLTRYNDRWVLSDALVERDGLLEKRSLLASLVDQASFKQERYSRTEIKFISTVKVKDIQKEVDKLAKEYREFDTKIQGLNWLTDLV